MRDVQQLICMIVLSVAPLSFIAIGLPAQRLCKDTLSTVYPLAMRQSYVAPHRTAIVTSQSKIRVVQVGRWHTVLSGVEACMPRRFAIRHASAANGQISPPQQHHGTQIALCAILGVGNQDGSTVRTEEGVKAQFMVKQLAIAPQTDIAFPQQNFPLRSTVPWCCIPSDLEEGEECHNN
jgi:hypothetical protein